MGREYRVELRSSHEILQLFPFALSRVNSIGTVEALWFGMVVERRVLFVRVDQVGEAGILTSSTKTLYLSNSLTFDLSQFIGM